MTRPPLRRVGHRSTRCLRPPSRPRSPRKPSHRLPAGPRSRPRRTCWSPPAPARAAGPFEPALGKGLLALLPPGANSTREAWEEVEDTLLAADLGVQATTELVDKLRTRVKIENTTDEASVRRWLHEDLLALVDPSMDRSVANSRIEGRPAVVLVVGVNGTGKTTTVGKLARVLVAEDKDVVLGAADTFRAAAADQLQTWGARRRADDPLGP